MNREAQEVILRHFCQSRRLPHETLPRSLADMICAASGPYLLMIECLDQMDSDPSNGLLVKLIDRAYQTTAGSLALIAIGHLREAEILARSIYESSVTTAYIADHAPPLRLVQYFRAYVKEEREQNRKWAKDAEDAPPDIRASHADRIRQKNEAMDAYDGFIDTYIAHCGLDHERVDVWPRLIDRLSAMGRRLDYRTVYAAMCSQSHHDAEDVLNHFFANSVKGADDFGDRMEREADTFSIFMVLFGLQWFVEAIVAVGRHLKFQSVVAEGMISLQRVVRELETVGPHLDTGEFPNNWLLKRS